MAMRRKMMGGPPQENRGAGLEQPVMDPDKMGAGDQQYQARVQRPQPQMAPLPPAVPGMGGVGGAMPGGGDDSTAELMMLLQQMMGGYK